MRDLEREPSLGDMVHELTKAGSDLVAAEVRLAEAKLAQRLAIAGPAVLLIAVGGAFAFIALLTVMFAFGAFLATSMSTVAAAAVVAAASLALGLTLFFIGRRRFVRIFGGQPASMGQAE